MSVATRSTRFKGYIPESITVFFAKASSGVSGCLKTMGPFETVASPVGSSKLAYNERPEPRAGGAAFEGFDIYKCEESVVP